GRYAFEHRTCGNDPLVRKGAGVNARDLKEKVIGNLDRFEPIPKVLGQLGYLSHQSGKWWEGHFQRGGFTHGMTLGLGNTPRGRHGDLGLKIGRQGMEPIEAFLDEAMAEKKRFFLWYAPFLPHTPHNPPARLLDRYADKDLPAPIQKYAAMCTWFDESCGELLQLLEEKKLRSNTLVVYVCDNGWTSSVKGVNVPDDWSAPYAPRTKRSPYDGGVRTPMMFNWPGRIKPQDRPERISSLDIYPTVLAAAGAPVPSDLSGLNLLPYLETGSSIPRQTLYGEAFGHDIQDIDDPESSLLNRWCIEGDWKLIVSYPDDLQGGSARVRQAHLHPPQLFQLKNDPEEEDNLAAKHPERVQQLKQKLQSWYPVEKGLIGQ
ncbi:MAG: sulfatase-like hydrolase/transferase, partial [Planctomycetota bacterium]|nr:sulfatase-like hydrolase/transferase [Planctomycetota bacterium]